MFADHTVAGARHVSAYRESLAFDRELFLADVHYGRAEAMIAQRQRTLQQAWAQHPERFVRGKPKPQALPTEVWINRPLEEETSPEEGQ